MNGPFIVAQANTASTAQGAQKKSVKVTKPSDGQAITVELSHDQPIKIDLTAIAGENVTLTRIGERLIILFDNRSTVTIEPYLEFDECGVRSVSWARRRRHRIPDVVLDCDHRGVARRRDTWRAGIWRGL